MLAALALCAVLLVSLVPAARAAQADGQLQFDENGEFRILIVADTQDIDKPQKETIALLEAELDAAQPDLVVFLGDQIHGPSTGRSVERTQKALDAILQPVAARELPFAVVFGNHDDEGGVDKKTQPQAPLIPPKNIPAGAHRAPALQDTEQIIKFNAKRCSLTDSDCTFY